MAYLNTYQIWQCYGGPEEGGWWYPAGTPVQSVFLGDQSAEEYVEAREWEDIKDLCEKATINYTEGREPKPIRNSTGGYNFMPGSDIPSTYVRDDDYTSVIEDHYAEDYPQEKPRYE